jgi:hypothetical protein
MKTKTTSVMVALIITLVAFFVFRLMIFFFVAEPGISVHVDGIVYSLSKNMLTLGLWALLGFPAVVVSIFVLWERRRSRADGQQPGRQ